MYVCLYAFMYVIFLLLLLVSCITCNNHTLFDFSHLHPLPPPFTVMLFFVRHLELLRICAKKISIIIIIIITGCLQLHRLIVIL